MIADMPGLIEGASEGRGLGHHFLRHVERTRVLVGVVDGAGRDPVEEWRAVAEEVRLHDPRAHGAADAARRHQARPPGRPASAGRRSAPPSGPMAPIRSP